MHFINYTFRKSTKITQINNIIAYGVTVESFYDHTCLYALFEFPVCMFLIHEHSFIFPMFFRPWSQTTFAWHEKSSNHLK